jgi:hypothetical protein
VYSTCLFCNSPLGRNDSIEIFPVGRRLAFDAARGRLWVVCRACGRWNLSPLEERWEAFEECERRFRATRVRVSTEHIGLARLPDGLELVRIGEPLRPEFAAWRYGDQFGRRRRKSLLVAGAGLLTVGAVWGGGLVGGGLFGTWLLYSFARNAVKGNPDKVVAQVPVGDRRIKVKRKLLERVALRPLGAHDFLITVPESDSRVIEVSGPEALRAAGLLLPPANRYGGDRLRVQRAVGELERSASPERYISDVAHRPDLNTSLPRLPTTIRLALEMAAHEEAERRALEGELARLEEAWRDAEEIAAISDSLLLPDSVTRGLRGLAGR